MKIIIEGKPKEIAALELALKDGKHTICYKASIYAPKTNPNDLVKKYNESLKTISRVR
jgi:hypothetical protein